MKYFQVVYYDKLLKETALNIRHRLSPERPAWGVLKLAPVYE
jgi:hypothetical protein